MDQRIVDAAAAAFGLTDLEVGEKYGQKLVFAAKRGDESVMVKLVELNPPDHELTLERARREVALLARVDHPNVVKLVDDLIELGGDPPTAVGWLEERLDGQDLRSSVGTRWPEPDVIAMGRQVSHGLAAMHTANVVHRDLSAGNVFACTDGRYVVLDPGLARHLNRSALTGVFQPGTPGFFTPEHVSALGRPTPASDVFGVGILLYLVSTGELPFPIGADLAAYRRELATGQAPSVASKRPDLSPPLASVIDRCLHRQSGRRYLNGQELANAMDAL